MRQEIDDKIDNRQQTIDNKRQTIFNNKLLQIISSSVNIPLCSVNRLFYLRVQCKITMAVFLTPRWYLSERIRKRLGIEGTSTQCVESQEILAHLRCAFELTFGIKRLEEEESLHANTQTSINDMLSRSSSAMPLTTTLDIASQQQQSGWRRPLTASMQNISLSFKIT